MLEIAAKITSSNVVISLTPLSLAHIYQWMSFRKPFCESVISHFGNVWRSVTEMLFYLPSLRIRIDQHLPTSYTALCQRHFQVKQILTFKGTPVFPSSKVTPWTPQISSCKVTPLILTSRRTPACFLSLHHVRTFTTKVVKHRVIVSLSTCIFDNLSLEEWLYDNADLDNISYLLIWRNKETVVIGRHQNPWLESNVPLLEQRGVDIARRNSGGGTVYHDLGNINFCFLTSRPRYNRKWNLNLVTKAVNDRWMLNLNIDDRDCIMWNDMFKVSGTAARFNSKRAYHHFTLLLNVNLSNLHSFLHSPLLGVRSRATASIPSSVVNLVDVEPQLTFDNVVQCVAQEFLRLNHDSQPTSIDFISPFDLTNSNHFPGFDKIFESRTDWKWIFGKTPAFTLDRHFISPCYLNSRETSLKIHCKIQDGCINVLDIQLSPLDETHSSLAALTQNILLTERLSQNNLQAAFQRLRLQISRDIQVPQHLLDWFVNSLWVTLIG